MRDDFSKSGELADPVQMTMLTVLCPRCGVDMTGDRHAGHCIHCGAHIGARSSAEWSRKVRQPCGRCGRPW